MKISLKSLTVYFIVYILTVLLLLVVGSVIHNRLKVEEELNAKTYPTKNKSERKYVCGKTEYKLDSTNIVAVSCKVT